MEDELYCYNCNRVTSRINHDLQLPSCCRQCDDDLYEDIKEAFDERKT